MIKNLLTRLDVNKKNNYDFNLSIKNITDGFDNNLYLSAKNIYNILSS